MELFNFRNVATTSGPVTISGAAIGLDSVIDSVELFAQVVEPPALVFGATGTQFHSAAIRLKLDLNLVDLQLNTSTLVSGLLSALGPLVAVQADASLVQLDLYTEVASGSGVLTAIDSIADAVSLQATPGVADIYLGDISDALFYNRTRAIDPLTDLDFGVIGSLNLVVTNTLLSTTLADVTAGIEAKALAEGTSGSQLLTFNGAFPESQTAGDSATFITNLLSSLLGSLELQLDNSLGLLLDPVVDGTILPALSPIVSSSLSPVLDPILTDLVDPSLDSLGIGLGEMDVNVRVVSQLVGPIGNPDFAVVPEDGSTIIEVLGNDASVAGNTISIDSVVQPAHGTVAANLDGTITYTPDANFFGIDTFTYQSTNGYNLSASTLVSVAVTPLNDAPVSTGVALLATEDLTLNASAQAS